MVWVFSSVFPHVHFQVVNSICCKVAQCALVRFLSSVNENVCLQIAFYIERLVALWAHVFFTFSLWVAEGPVCLKTSLDIGLKTPDYS